MVFYFLLYLYTDIILTRAIDDILYRIHTSLQRGPTTNSNRIAFRIALMTLGDTNNRHLH